jgi:hypothetical protein
VVRRAVWVDAPAMRASLLAYFREGGSGVSGKYLDAIEEAAGNDSCCGPSSKESK